jgi:hypothetical protein
LRGGRYHTAIDLLWWKGVYNLGHSEVGCVASLTFLYIHNAGKFFPHAVLPFEVVFLHALVVVAFTTLTDSGSAHLSKVFVDLLRDNVVVFIRPVAETENDIFEAIEFMFTLAKFKRLIRKVLHKLYSVVGRLAFTVCSHHKDGGTALGNFIQILKVIFLGITNEGGETELGLGFLSDTNGVFFSCPCLRPVEDDKALFLQNNYKNETERYEKTTYSSLHLRNEITRIPMTVCLFDRGGSGFWLKRRAEDLVTEEIKSSQDDAQDEDEDVCGHWKRHGKFTEAQRGGGEGKW